MKSAVIAYGSVLLLGTVRLALDKGMRFFTKGHWKPCTFILIAGTPALATSHWVFNHYLYDTAFITRLRELFFYGNLGTVITFSGADKKCSKRLLGNDYFRKEFSTLA